MKKPKAIKVFVGDVRMRDIYPYATRFQVFKWHAIRKARNLFILAGIAGVAYSGFQIGHKVSSAKIVYADRPVEVIKEIRTIPPVMKRIAKCESNDSHIDPKTGLVYMLANTNKTVDVGKYMINTVWHKKAVELGFDITTEKGNEDMAMWIYETRGTQDWKFSASCWNK